LTVPPPIRLESLLKIKIWYKEKEKGGYDVAISVLNFF